MPRIRKSVVAEFPPAVSAVAARLAAMSLWPGITTDALPGHRINCRVPANHREGEQSDKRVGVGYVRILPSGGVRLCGLRSAHQLRVYISLSAAGFAVRI